MVEKNVIINKINLLRSSNKYFNIKFKKRKIAKLVERWFPKPKAKGSIPFFPVIFE